MKSLTTLYQAWKMWAVDADRAEDGWESDFPAWDDLISAAIAVMAQSPFDESQLPALELIWGASEETEDLAEWAREHIDQSWDVLARLAGSKDPRVRWQVYDVLGSAGAKALSLLKAALDDGDPYARRRAILSLARLAPQDAAEIAARFVNDDDPYVRQAAVMLAASV